MVRNSKHGATNLVLWWPSLVPRKNLSPLGERCSNMDGQLRQIHIIRPSGLLYCSTVHHFWAAHFGHLPCRSKVINPIPIVDTSRYQQCELSHVSVMVMMMMMMNSTRHSVGLSSPADQQHIELHAFATQR